MGKFKIFAALLVICLVSACGASNSAYQRDLADIKKQLALEQTSRRALEQQMLAEAKQRRIEELQAQRSAPAPAPQSAGRPDAAAVAMAVQSQPEPFIPDQIFWSNKPPPGCPPMLLVRFINESTSVTWIMGINERNAIIRMRDGLRSDFRPGQVVWACFPDTGEQEIMGVGYIDRFGQPLHTKDLTFSVRIGFGTWLGAMPYHDVRITDATPRMNSFTVNG